MNCKFLLRQRRLFRVILWVTIVGAALSPSLEGTAREASRDHSAPGTAQPARDSVEPAANGESRLRRDYSGFPLSFIENRGQLDPTVGYYVPGRDKTVYLASDGLTFAFSRRGKTADRWALKLDFVDANRAARPQGISRTDTVVSYFSGGPSNWKSGVPSFSSIVYKDLWPGIDLVYSGTVNRLKYSFTVRPGADPNRIRLRYRGASEVSLNSRGELQVATPLGSFHDETPVSFQASPSQLSTPADDSIETTYRIISKNANETVYGFRVGAYDTARELVIDPAVLIYCGFIGGSGGDEKANAIAVDASGSAYVVGETDSTQTTFPVVVGPDTSFNGGQTDAFIAKVNAAGTAFVYVGYIGGADADRATGVAVDSAGSAYVSGETFSTQATFPVLVGPRLAYTRNGDAFVAKVNAAGTGLEYCGYIGGDGRDFSSAIALDTARNAYIVGFTDSTESTFPTAVGPRLLSSGAVDAYVTKVTPTGNAIVYSGFIGGSANDYGRDIAVSGTGEAYVTGDTASNQTTFPVTVGPDLTFNGGERDGFVAKITATGATFSYAGYVGGSGTDIAHGIAIDSTGNAYLTGETTSDQSTFPVFAGPDISFNGGFDAFISKLNPSGTSFIYSGYIGGTGNESGLAIDVDSAGNAYAAGETSSFQTSFPVVGGPKLQASGVLDGFVAKVNVPGNSLIYCGYLGGAANERVNGIAVDTNGNAYVAGYTESNQLTFPVIVGPDLTFNGGETDAFVAKIERRPDITPPVVASVGAVSRSRGSSSVATLAFVSDEDTRPGNIFVGLKNIPAGIGITDVANNNGTVAANLNVACTAPSGSFPVVIEATDGAGLKSSSEVTINVTANTPPVLGSYPSTQILTVGGGAIITPASPPVDNGVIETMIAAAPGFSGVFSVNKVTGVITVTNAGPRELYTVTVTATDNCQVATATTFQLAVGEPNPIPTISNVTPNLIAVGTQGATITVIGTNFVNGSKVRWNGSDRVTTFISAQELRANITTQDLSALGTASVTVFNAVPGGGVSNAVSVSIVNSAFATNAASFSASSIAPDSIAALFGINLATATAAAGTIPLPTELAGTTVTILDSAGVNRLAPLFYVSPGQINFAVPTGTATGSASITVRNSQNVFSIGTTQITVVAPGIFTANSTGSGVAAAQVLRIRSDGLRTLEPVARFDIATQTIVPIPIDLGAETDQLFLILFGTGIRYFSAIDKVEVVVGGLKLDTQFAGGVEGFVGLDQINAVLKRSLAGTGVVNAVVTVDGKPSNTFTLTFR
ncbi:MAG: SBBP repeat-containing protein [Acidobacteriota bacterium]